MEKKRITLTVSGDPLSSMEIGTSIHFRPVPFGGSNAQSRPDFVRNWGGFRGALLAVGFKSHAGLETVGSAFIAAPGLALSASHVFVDRLESMSKGMEVPYAWGIDGDEGRLWRITSVNTVDDDDIALLTLKADSALPKSGEYFQFPITTRTPAVGETLQIFGFRNEHEASSFNGNLIAASGQVSRVHYQGRDGVLLPYPAIEISAGSLGGMSGGVAIDHSGHAMGTISLGMESSEQSGPTYFAWVVKALHRKSKIEWPPGVFSEPISLIEMDEHLAMIEGRDAITVISETKSLYESWTHSSGDAPPGGPSD